MYQANYFYALSRKLTVPALSVNLIPFTGQGRPEDTMESILGAMDELRSIEPEIILLYATRESIELFLQQVIVDVALFSVSTMFFETLDFDQETSVMLCLNSWKDFLLRLFYVLQGNTENFASTVVILLLLLLLLLSS